MKKEGHLFKRLAISWWLNKTFYLEISIKHCRIEAKTRQHPYTEMSRKSFEYPGISWNIQLYPAISSYIQVNIQQYPHRLNIILNISHFEGGPSAQAHLQWGNGTVWAQTAAKKYYGLFKFVSTSWF